MSTVYELVYHKELNLSNCFCGYVGLFHHCTRKIRGFIKIASCPTNYKLCEKEVNRKEYSSFRWKTNPDGYAICGHVMINWVIILSVLIVFAVHVIRH